VEEQAMGRGGGGGGGGGGGLVDVGALHGGDGVSCFCWGFHDPRTGPYGGHGSSAGVIDLEKKLRKTVKVP